MFYAAVAFLVISGLFLVFLFVSFVRELRHEWHPNTRADRLLKKAQNGGWEEGPHPCMSQGWSLNSLAVEACFRTEEELGVLLTRTATNLDQPLLTDISQLSDCSPTQRYEEWDASPNASEGGYVCMDWRDEEAVLVSYENVRQLARAELRRRSTCEMFS